MLKQQQGGKTEGIAATTKRHRKDDVSSTSGAYFVRHSDRSPVLFSDRFPGALSDLNLISVASAPT